MSTDRRLKLADAIWAYEGARDDFEMALKGAGFEIGEHFQSIGWDHYDCSIEFYKANDDVRLTAEQQRIVADAGFAKAYINHKNGWETHYSWDWREPFAVHRGWRRRYVSGDPGYYEISYWPEGWGSRDAGRCAQWLKNGYVRIVPDLLTEVVPQ